MQFASASASMFDKRPNQCLDAPSGSAESHQEPLGKCLLGAKNTLPGLMAPLSGAIVRRGSTICTSRTNTQPRTLPRSICRQVQFFKVPGVVDLKHATSFELITRACPSPRHDACCGEPGHIMRGSEVCILDSTKQLESRVLCCSTASSTPSSSCCTSEAAGKSVRLNSICLSGECHHQVRWMRRCASQA